VRSACVAFWLLLTLLLLSPDPRALLGLESWANWPPGSKAAHIICFTLLAILAHLSRPPLSRTPLLAALAAYAVATEGLQYFVPNRAPRIGDVALDLLGLAIGTTLLHATGAGTALALRHRIGVRRAATVEVTTMYNVQRFRIVTVEGLLSHDTFVVAAAQSTPKAGCLVVINERDGAMMTVHRDRLVPVEPVAPPILYHESRTACLKCGHVEGVVQDHVTCPFHGDLPCGLLAARKARVQLTSPMASG
jgi:hypothetical protein